MSLIFLQGVSVDDVVNSGPGLVFITYPEVVLKLPGGPIWAFIFFIMLVVGNSFISLMFHLSHFGFLGFFHFWAQSYEYMKILCNLCLHFARQAGQDGKNNGKKILQLKWPKYQKPKDENMGWTKHMSKQYWNHEIFMKKHS